MKRALRWAGYFIGWVAAVGAAGAVAGAVLFPVAGMFLHFNYTPLELVTNGARTGGYLSLVWAPAIATAACFMRAQKRKRPPTQA